MDLSKVAEYIIAHLKSEGVIVQRYNAYSTDSIYLKFDYGRAWSLRLSDHKGYSHLHYRYNLLASVKVNDMPVGSALRYFGKIDKPSVDTMIERILENRKKKLYYLGKKEYINQMKQMYTKYKSTKGFWSQAKVV